MDHHETLTRNIRLSSGMADLWALDTNQDLYQNFEQAKLKVLLVFLSRCKDKAVSSTYSCLSTLMKDGRERETDIFIDACFYQGKPMLSTLASIKVPPMTGIASHRDWRDYDIVAVSQAITLEGINLFHMYSQSAFPFSHEEWFQDPECPIVLYGGASAAAMFPAMGGRIEGHGKSVYDIGILGMGEPILPPLFQFLYAFNLEHSIKANKGLLIDKLLDDETFRTRLLYPFLYDIEHKGGRIVSITRLDPRIPEKVKFNRNHYPIFKGFYKKIFYPCGVGCNKQDVQIASGCSSYACSFCMEGQEGGHYTEKPLSEIEEDIWKSKGYSAANTISPFSYNSNYYSQYYSMLQLFITHSSQISITNQRADVIASSPKYVEVARKLGATNFSTACEGISERLRQNFLNKNLSRRTLMQACRNVFSQKFLKFKFTMILTGYEDESDYAEFFSMVDEILRIRLECHAHTSMSITFTPLTVYLQTPLRYIKRITAKQSWEHTKTLEKMVPFLKERNIGIHFNGTGIITYYEQLMIDAGWQATNILKDLALDYGIDYIRGVFDSTQPCLKAILDKYGIPHDFFFDGFDPEGDILPNDIIDFTTPKKLEEWKQMFRNNDYYHPLCLKTGANPNPKCYGCGSCYTAEEKKQVCTRTLNDHADIHTVLQSLSKSKPKSVLRFVIRQYPMYAFYSKEMLSHYIASQFIRRDNAIHEAFYQVKYNSATWVSDFEQLPMYSGLFIFDVEFKKPITAQHAIKYKDEINKVLETCQIVEIFDEQVQDEITSKDLQLYLCKVPFFTPEQLRERLLDFDYVVKVPKEAYPHVMFVSQDFTPYKDSILYKAYRGGVVMAMALPIIYTPFSVIQAITKKPLEYCQMQSDVQIIDTGKSLGASCKCGKSMYYSLTYDTVRRECPVCRLKKALSILK